QSRRNNAYRSALALLEKRNLIYRCNCSRKEIADSSIIGIDGPVYSGVCRGGSPNGEYPGAWRVRTDDHLIEFKDALRGMIRQRLESDIGDFILRRADRVFAYQLAVVVDDAEQAITHVVRGEDLLNSTPRQIYLQQLLGYPTPAYLHLPVAVNAQGEKLSKQTHAAPIDTSDPVSQLMLAIRFLGQAPPKELTGSNVTSFWKWATKNWKAEMIR
ncbi:MAG: glutamate--tRNA ligase family protein, partial [Nitrosospira sp.]|nr:glutamate--tRNA ligase family protein [Nitrosospira sp.]